MNPILRGFACSAHATVGNAPATLPSPLMNSRRGRRFWSGAGFGRASRAPAEAIRLVSEIRRLGNRNAIIEEQEITLSANLLAKLSLRAPVAPGAFDRRRTGARIEGARAWRIKNCEGPQHRPGVGLSDIRGGLGPEIDHCIAPAEFVTWIIGDGSDPLASCTRSKLSLLPCGCCSR
jgi:hypothetical protein